MRRCRRSELRPVEAALMKVREADSVELGNQRALPVSEHGKTVGGLPAALHLTGGASQSRGRVAGGASLRRSPLRGDCPAVLGARGRAQNSPSHGRHLAAQAACARCSDRLRSTPRLAAMRNPRTPALLGAAEAHRRPPAHGFARNRPRCLSMVYRASAHARFNRRLQPSTSALPRFKQRLQLSPSAPARCNRQRPPTPSSALAGTEMLTAGER